MARTYGIPAACLLALMAGLPGFRPVVAAGGAPRVVVEVVALKEVIVRDAAGGEKVELRPVAATGPGDTLVYRISCTNLGDVPAHDASVVDPIPIGTRLVPGGWDSAGAEFTVSVDGGRSFKTYPVTAPVRQPDGTTAIGEVDASAYTHVRWTSREPLAPGATRTAAFKVTVR